jgi:hypothetical protein
MLSMMNSRNKIETEFMKKKLHLLSEFRFGETRNEWTNPTAFQNTVRTMTLMGGSIQPTEPPISFYMMSPKSTRI